MQLIKFIYDFRAIYNFTIIKEGYSAKLKVQSLSPHPGHLKPSSGKFSSSNSCPHLSHFHRNVYPF
ncbi:hypothetical protein LCGC14_1654870 [marine sediment metagenome]|uniref:Uncharacterized protein n=1 Tax=marine sediment metagenome TaxID=412755 RepID=A0A0F9KBR5_9ZZZZ